MPNSIAKRLSLLIGNTRVRRAAKVLGAVILLYGIIGFFILPGVVKSKLEALGTDKLQRPTSIAAVEVNPFTLALTVRGLRMQERGADAVFAAFDTLHVDLSSESLLRLAPVVREVHLSAPRVRLVRSGAHRYNIDDIIAMFGGEPEPEGRARFAINNIRVERGVIMFDDQPAKTLHEVSELALGIPFLSSLPSQVHIFVEPLLSAKVNGAPLLFKGRARPFADPADAVLELKLDGLDLTRYVDYLPVKPRGKIAGAKLDTNLTASFRQPQGKAPALVLQGDAALKALQVLDPQGKPVLRAKEFALRLQEADVFGGRAHVAKAVLDGLQADLTRDADGALNLAGLLPAAGNAGSAGGSAAARKTSSGFRLTLDEFALRGAALRYSDAAAQTSVERLDAGLRKLALDTGKRSVQVGEIASGRADIAIEHAIRTAPPAQADVAAAAADGGAYVVSIAKAAVDNWSLRVRDRAAGDDAPVTEASLNLALQDLSNAAGSRARVRLEANVNKSGSLGAEGALALSPLHADLALDIKGVDLLPLQPYVADRINLRVRRAELSADGRLLLDAAQGGIAGGFKGNAALGNVATVDRAGGNDFLRWKTLHASGIDLRLAPFSMSVDALALSDFFARIIIDPAGRINLQDVLRADPGEAQGKAAAHGGAGKAPMPPVSIGKVSLQGGRVRFTDNFIKPNYSASLSAFGGALAGLSSDPASTATVDLRGEVNGAPLSVGGRFNPLRGDLFLDLKAAVRGMELAPLSAYSGKYVGYGIEKGKLSFDVAYQLERRKLSANNRLVLEQLSFGDKVDSPNATSLPVPFAVALLADRNGVIDLNLPVAGSLDDPQFSIGAVLFRAIGNAITKAATQPFAVLGALFGQGAELSSMTFDPGRATVPAAGEEKLRALARALTERPGLKLDITGHAAMEADREGMKQVQVERKLRMLKMRDLQARGVAVEPGSVTVGRDEYPDLLRRAYRDETFAKPRNLLGLPRDLPVAEMEKLMLANAEIDEDDLRALGNQRAQAVKTWLQRHGQVPPERMFIVAARVGRASKEGSAAPSRVDFALR